MSTKPQQLPLLLLFCTKKRYKKNITRPTTPTTPTTTPTTTTTTTTSTTTTTTTTQPLLTEPLGGIEWRWTTTECSEGAACSFLRQFTFTRRGLLEALPSVDDAVEEVVATPPPRPPGGVGSTLEKPADCWDSLNRGFLRGLATDDVEVEGRCWGRTEVAPVARGSLRC